MAAHASSTRRGGLENSGDRQGLVRSANLARRRRRFLPENVTVAGRTTPGSRRWKTDARERSPARGVPARGVRSSSDRSAAPVSIVSASAGASPSRAARRPRPHRRGGLRGRPFDARPRCLGRRGAGQSGQKPLRGRKTFRSRRTPAFSNAGDADESVSASVAVGSDDDDTAEVR